MIRILRGTLLVGLVGSALVVAGGGFAGAQDAAPPCKLATKGDSPVAKACKDGGIKKAKQVMKELTKKAKAAGTKFDCDDCHKDDAHYDLLTDDGNDKFKKLLAAAEGKK